MGGRLGGVMWLRRIRGWSTSGIASEPISARSGDVWADDDGERISVFYEDEQVMAVDLAPSEFVIEAFAGAKGF